MPEKLDARGKPPVQTENDGPILTVQSEAEQGEINKILKRYKEVGIIEQLNLTEASFRDVSEFGDFADVMRQSKEAELEFMKLPSKVREIFNHDVANWLDTAHDAEKRSSLIAAGEIEPLKQPTPGDLPPDAGGDATPENPSS